jgi:hypothetical protein
MYNLYRYHTLSSGMYPMSLNGRHYSQQLFPVPSGRVLTREVYANFYAHNYTGLQVIVICCAIKLALRTYRCCASSVSVMCCVPFLIAVRFDCCSKRDGVCIAMAAASNTHSADQAQCRQRIVMCIAVGECDNSTAAVRNRILHCCC